jgi:hypothetical protein
MFMEGWSVQSLWIPAFGGANAEVENLTSTKLCLAIATGALLVCASNVHSEILSPEEVHALNWPGPMATTLAGATDGVFEGGPHYRYAHVDKWISESDVVDDRWNFMLSIHNGGAYPLDDVLLLIAHRGGNFSTLTVGDWSATQDNFQSIELFPFGPTGNRPGGGEAGVYKNASGVLFLRLREEIPAGGVLQVPVTIEDGRADFRLHVDFYGLRRSKVFCTCTAAKDISCIPAINPAATVEETWGKVKALFAW